MVTMAQLLKQKVDRVKGNGVGRSESTPSGTSTSPSVLEDRVTERIVDLNLELVKRLATIQCTPEEIASVLGYSRDSLMEYPGFLEAMRRGLQFGRRALRRRMFNQAMHGDRSLLIWLSKNYLQMKDTGSLELSGGDSPIAVNLGLDASVVAEALSVLVESGVIKE